MALGATHDRCRVTLAFNVKRGEVEGVDVSGVVVAAVADTPKVMSDGNWSLGDAFGIQYEGNAAFSTSGFSWTA